MSKIKCPIHPEYKGFIRPRSKKKGCICKQVYQEVQKELRDYPLCVRNGYFRKADWDSLCGFLGKVRPDTMRR